MSLGSMGMIGDYNLMYRPQQADLLNRWDVNTPGGDYWVNPNYGTTRPWVNPNTVPYGPFPSQPIQPIFGPINPVEPRLDEEQIARLRRLVEEATRTAPARPPEPPPVQAQPAATPEPEGVNTEDSFKPGRKLDLD